MIFNIFMMQSGIEGDDMSNKKTRLGLTQAEFDNLLQAIRYGMTIIIAVLITFIIVASISNFFDYTPPPPSNYEAPVEATLVND